MHSLHHWSCIKIGCIP